MLEMSIVKSAGLCAELFHVCVARPGRRQPQSVPGWSHGSIYSCAGSPPPGPRQPSGSANGTRAAVGSSSRPRNEISPHHTATHETEAPSSSGTGPNGVMHASAAAQAAVQAAAHEAHARVSQPTVPPVLAQAPSLVVTSARGTSTDVSKDRTQSLGAERTPLEVAAPSSSRAQTALPHVFLEARTTR
jgi:hypothetical protein